MTFQKGLWQEADPVLRGFNEQEIIDGVNAGLAVRPLIEKTVDKIWEEGFDAIWFMGISGTWASGMQAEIYMRGKSSLPVYLGNAAEFLTIGDKKFTPKTLAVISSVSGTTAEMVDLAKRIHELGAKILGFIDNEKSILAQESDYLISAKGNDALKFLMLCNYLMYKNGEFDEYERFNAEMEAHLGKALAAVEKETDDWARAYVKKQAAFREQNPDYPIYFVGSGMLYPTAYSMAMCSWEEGFWLRTKSIAAQEFFHGMMEIVVKDTPLIILIGEDASRPLAERVARFVPQVSENYVILDTKEFELDGMAEEFRSAFSHIVMRSVFMRLNAYWELELRHPRRIRRYYRQLKY